MTTGSTGSLFPKWQLAVLLGAPIAIGLGYLYYRNQSTELHDDDDKKKKLGELKGQTISLDGDEKLTPADQKAAEQTTAKVLTPLDQATQFKNDGNVCFRKGKYDEAIVHYDKAIDTCPTSSAVDLSTFYQNRAAAYEQLKKWSAVRDDCSKALALNPRYVKALHRRARAHEYLKEFFASLEDITATCILEGFQNNSTLAFADRILKHIGQADAIKELRTRKPILPSANFVQTYFSSFKHDPIQRIVVASTAPKGFVRAKLAFEAQQYEDIIASCTEEIESTESEGEYKNEATLLRGTFFLLTGQTAESLLDFDRIINNPEASVDMRTNALIKKASLMIQNDDGEKGFENFRLAEELDANNADIYHQRGQVYILINDLQKAVVEFTKAVELAPDQGMTYVQKCYSQYRYAYTQQDQVAMFAVIGEFKDAIDRFPDCVECYSVMAQVLTEQGQYEQADLFFEKAIKRSPSSASMYVHRGIMQLQWNGDIDKAMAYMRKGIEIDDKCELAFETLGTIEVQRGNLENAVELFSTAITLAKSEAELVHLHSLKNAAVAQINVAKKLGIDMSSLTALAAAAIS